MDTEEDLVGYWMDCDWGRVPNELHGTLFRNGPGKFTVGTDKVAHPYDGDGLILSITFRDGRAFFHSHFVRTAEYVAESQEQRIMFRGTFATQRRGGQGQNALDLHVKNTSNTNVVCWGGRLWTLFEAGQPYRLNPRTLETEGMETLDGQLRVGMPFDMGSPAANRALGSFLTGTQERLGNAHFMPPTELLAAGGDAMTAHPHVDSTTGRLLSFSYQVTHSFTKPMGTTLTFWEYTPEFAVAAKTTFELAGFPFLHDFAFTANYYVIYENPVKMDYVPYITGKAPAAACVHWNEGKPALLHLIPRPGRTDAQGRPLQHRSFTAPSMFVFHHANAFESEDGQHITIDSIHYDSMPALSLDAMAEQQIDLNVALSSRLRRVEADLGTGTLRMRKLYSDPLEMVVINESLMGTQQRFVYGCQTILQPNMASMGIVKVDTSRGSAAVWQPGHQKYALEPKFVGRPGSTQEDDGWLLTVVFDSATLVCRLVILDARDVEAGPVATLRFRQPVPSGLHGCWTATSYAPGVV
ncbi:hypothetical protein CHLNCDRAFT_134121 [Chlorella variabilis]|uniref:Dioxygenase n=1 Tax=Chlorella variabilis TaxID=554065 RepID=E1ZF17_CHLVA|nr:hypothetical protein CHLNCDRAFT_134121 [Chlorella variabilis]EFN55590.1 hypothetical protein CHLNCDRAFT_134121 [Chlorella variabilis]|eukprot:XP_005847692.1 hypothetical protein CHLNCDRAFT_134121 [Chlorella variabilis]